MTATIVIIEIIVILILHWVGDYLIQTEWQGRNKSTSHIALSTHVLNYTAVFCLPFLALYFTGYMNPALGFFLPITMVCHWVTDYYTSRWSKTAREAEKYYGWGGFFPILGLDQALHFIQLYSTYFLLQY